ncbi:conserved Plasmodium protein, unknown function [Plasmodium ovale curtisi]|uniref:Uncharacterized protein n=1 Tax=Plasmodium ovale curtisi TaxID=864141 RepID=A0A1A8W0S6_PLAOA|nr:conserved Plasmodium protein, unknown function [Plasmodium ovale curtisi]
MIEENLSDRYQSVFVNEKGSGDYTYKKGALGSGTRIATHTESFHYRNGKEEVNIEAREDIKRQKILCNKINQGNANMQRERNDQNETGLPGPFDIRNGIDWRRLVEGERGKKGKVSEKRKGSESEKRNRRECKKQKDDNTNDRVNGHSSKRRNNHRQNYDIEAKYLPMKKLHAFSNKHMNIIKEGQNGQSNSNLVFLPPNFLCINGNFAIDEQRNMQSSIDIKDVNDKKRDRVYFDEKNRSCDVLNKHTEEKKTHQCNLSFSEDWLEKNNSCLNDLNGLPLHSSDIEEDVNCKGTNEKKRNFCCEHVDTNDAKTGNVGRSIIGCSSIRRNRGSRSGSIPVKKRKKMYDHKGVLFSERNRAGCNGHFGISRGMTPIICRNSGSSGGSEEDIIDRVNLYSVNMHSANLSSEETMNGGNSDKRKEKRRKKKKKNKCNMYKKDNDTFNIKNVIDRNILANFIECVNKQFGNIVEKSCSESYKKEKNTSTKDRIASIVPTTEIGGEENIAWAKSEKEITSEREAYGLEKYAPSKASRNIRHINEIEKKQNGKIAHSFLNTSRDILDAHIYQGEGNENDMCKSHDANNVFNCKQKWKSRVNEPICGPKDFLTPLNSYTNVEKMFEIYYPVHATSKEDKLKMGTYNIGTSEKDKKAFTPKEKLDEILLLKEKWEKKNSTSEMKRESDMSLKTSTKRKRGVMGGREITEDGGEISPDKKEFEKCKYCVLHILNQEKRNKESSYNCFRTAYNSLRNIYYGALGSRIGSMKVGSYSTKEESDNVTSDSGNITEGAEIPPQGDAWSNLKKDYESFRNYLNNSYKMNSSAKDYFLNLYCHMYVRHPAFRRNAKIGSSSGENILISCGSAKSFQSMKKEPVLVRDEHYVIDGLPEGEGIGAKKDAEVRDVEEMDEESLPRINYLVKKYIQRVNRADLHMNKKQPDQDRNILNRCRKTENYDGKASNCSGTMENVRNSAVEEQEERGERRESGESNEGGERDEIGKSDRNNRNDRNDRNDRNYLSELSDLCGKNNEMKGVLFSYYNYLKLKDYIIPYNIYGNAGALPKQEDRATEGGTYCSHYVKDTKERINISYNFINEHKSGNNNITYDNFCNFHRDKISRRNALFAKIAAKGTHNEANAKGQICDVSNHYSDRSGQSQDCTRIGLRSCARGCAHGCIHRFARRKLRSNDYFYAAKVVIENLEREELQKLMLCQCCYLLKKIENKMTPLDVILDTQILFHDCNTYFKKKGWIHNNSSEKKRNLCNPTKLKERLGPIVKDNKCNGEVGTYVKHFLEEIHNGKGNNDTTVQATGASFNAEAVCMSHNKSGSGKSGSGKSGSGIIGSGIIGSGIIGNGKIGRSTSESIHFYSIENHEISRTSTTASSSYRSGAVPHEQGTYAHLCNEDNTREDENFLNDKDIQGKTKRDDSDKKKGCPNVKYVIGRNNLKTEVFKIADKKLRAIHAQKKNLLQEGKRLCDVLPQSGKKRKGKDRDTATSHWKDASLVKKRNTLAEDEDGKEEREGTIARKDVC